MNYEKKYKDALERAREIHNEHRAQCFDVMVKVFPELKENENEESKKWILEYLYDGLRKSDEQFKGQFKAAIAWLEKQGKTSWMPSKEEMDVLYGLAYITNEFDEQKEEVITRLYQDLKRVFFNGVSFENMFPTNTSTELEKQGEQKITDANGDDIDLAEEGCFEPIPLTEEFFEKNGIKKVIYNYIEPCVIFESDDKRIQINEWTNSGDGYWNVHIDNEDFETVGACDVKYVHQFQQLLRLCGYEMDVVV